MSLKHDPLSSTNAQSINNTYNWFLSAIIQFLGLLKQIVIDISIRIQSPQHDY